MYCIVEYSIIVKLANEDFFCRWCESTGKVAKENAVFHFMKASLSEVEFEQHSDIVDQASKKFCYHLTDISIYSYVGGRQI